MTLSLSLRLARRITRKRRPVRHALTPRLDCLEGRQLLATLTWKGQSNFLNSKDNWDLGRAPADGDDLVFPGDITLQHIIYNDLPSTRLLSSIDLAGGYTISPQPGGAVIPLNVGDISSHGFAWQGQSDNILNTPIRFTSAPDRNHTIGGWGALVFNGGITEMEMSPGQNAVITGTNTNDPLRVTFAGPGNGYTGTTSISLTSLTLKSAGKSILGDLSVAGIDPNAFNSISTVTLGAAGQFGPNVDVSLDPAAFFNLNGFDASIASLTLNSASVQTGAGTLTLGGNLTASTVLRPPAEFAAAVSLPALIEGKLSLGAANRTFTLNVGQGAKGPSLLLNAAVSQSGSAPVGITAVGAGGLTIGGTSANTYQGLTTVNTTQPLLLNKTAGQAATPGGLVIPFARSATLLAADQIPDDKPVNLSVGVLNLNGYHETVGDLTLYASKVYTAGAGGNGVLGLAGKVIATRDASYGYSYISGSQNYNDPTFRQGRIELSPGEHVMNVNTPGGQGTGQFGEMVIYLPIEGAGGAVTKTGNGALSYDIAAPTGNTYDGLTTVRGGTLRLNAFAGRPAMGGDLLVQSTGAATSRVQWIQSNILKPGTSINVSGANAVVDLNGQSDTVASLNFAGGSVTTGTGNLFVKGGINATGTASISGRLGLVSPGTHVVNVANPTDVLTVSATIIASAITPADTGITKQGAGTLSMTGTQGNAYPGTTTVNAGTLVLGKTSGVSLAGPLTIRSGATVRFASDNELTPSAGVVVLGTLDLNGRSQTLTNFLTVDQGGLVRTGAGALTVSGTVLAGTGSGTIQGQLRLGGTAVPFTVADNAVLNVPANIGRGASVPANQSAGLTKLGAGRLLLGGNNTYRGQTVVNEGTLQVAGTLAGAVRLRNQAVLGGRGTIGGLTAEGGTVSPALGDPSKPGSTNPPSILTVNGNATLAPEATLAFTLDGSVAAPQQGRGATMLRVTGALTLSQTDGHGPSFVGTLLSSTVPASTVVYRVVQATSIANTFDGIVRPLGTTVVDVPPNGPARIFVVRSRRGTGVVDLNFNS